MKLRADWRDIIDRAWSVKFMVLAALLSGCEVIIPLLDPDTLPRGLFAALAGLTTAGALVARVLAQSEAAEHAAK